MYIFILHMQDLPYLESILHGFWSLFVLWWRRNKKYAKSIRMQQKEELWSFQTYDRWGDIPEWSYISSCHSALARHCSFYSRTWSNAPQPPYLPQENTHRGWRICSFRSSSPHLACYWLKDWRWKKDKSGTFPLTEWGKSKKVAKKDTFFWKKVLTSGYFCDIIFKSAAG